MIDLKKINYIISTGENNRLAAATSQILDFYELIGKNILFLSSKRDYLYYIISTNIIEYGDLNTLKKILSNKSNLFRLDLIVIDLRKKELTEHLKVLSDINIDVIIIYDNAEHIHIDETTTINEILLENKKHYISNLITNEKYTFDDYIKIHTRTIIIDKLLGDD